MSRQVWSIVIVRDFSCVAAWYAGTNGQIRPGETLGQLRIYGLNTKDDMVYLALTPEGLRDILDGGNSGPSRQQAVTS